MYLFKGYSAANTVLLCNHSCNLFRCHSCTTDAPFRSPIPSPSPSYASLDRRRWGKDRSTPSSPDMGRRWASMLDVQNTKSPNAKTSGRSAPRSRTPTASRLGAVTPTSGRQLPLPPINSFANGIHLEHCTLPTTALLTVLLSTHTGGRYSLAQVLIPC